jgi:DNA-binding transcriptional LysR family regulator
MDRIEAMKVFVATLDEGSLAGAGRKLGRSPAAVSRALAFLEEHVGTELLHRTTRSLRLSEAGERYAAACRRVLSELEEADLVVLGEKSAPRGTLTVTAPVTAGEEILRPILDAFIDAVPTVSVKLYFLDRPINLIEEGIDVALRIAHLADSSLVAVKVGEVRRVVTASPRYLASHPRIDEPADLAQHQIIAMTHFGHDSWSFPPPEGSTIPQTVQFKPRLVVNTVRSAVASASEGHGVTRLFSYHVAPQVREGSLEIILKDAEHTPLPVHLLTPYGRLSVPKVRAFFDLAVPRLRAFFTGAAVASSDIPPIQPKPGRLSPEARLFAPKSK